jgi:hypothetical protein
MVGSLADAVPIVLQFKENGAGGKASEALLRGADVSMTLKRQCYSVL